MIESWRYKTESDPDAFWYENKRIELREYQKDLLFYWSGEEDKAEYAIYDRSPVGLEAEIHSGGKFGSYSLLKSKAVFDARNFEGLRDNISLSFLTHPNTVGGYTTYYLKKKGDWESLSRGSYSMVIQADGEIQRTLVLEMKELDDFDTLKNRLSFELDPNLYNAEVDLDQTTTEIIAVKSAIKGRALRITSGSEGTDLLDILEVSEVNYGTYPAESIDIAGFEWDTGFLKISHIKHSSSEKTESRLKFTYSDSGTEKTTSIPWNSDGIKFDHIEVDIDSSVMYIFLNGELLKAVLVSPIKRAAGPATFYLGSTKDNPYSFEEVIIKGKLQNKESFAPPASQLTRYSTERPYIDFHFSGSDIYQNSLSDLVSECSENISYVLNYDGTFYYYISGGWRKSDGSYAQSADCYTFADYIREFTFTGKDDLFIRAYFDSDGDTEAYIQELYFSVSDEEILGDGKTTPAILIGEPSFPDTEKTETTVRQVTEKQLVPATEEIQKEVTDASGNTYFDTVAVPVLDSNGNQVMREVEVPVYNAAGNPVTETITEKILDEDGNPVMEPAVIPLGGKSLVITTDQGSTEMNFPEDMTLDEAVKLIKSKYPEGISSVYRDKNDHLVLISESKGADALISVSGDAADILFGPEYKSAQGTDQTVNTLEQAYKDFIEKLKTYSTDDLIPIEISDEQLRLYIQEAINLYKKYRSDDINTYRVQLEGNAEEGYEIPPAVPDWHDITDIIFKPLFPIGFYAGSFDNSAEDIIALTLVNAMVGQGGLDYGNFYGKGFTTDYYISLMNIDSMEMALGLKPTWNVMNHRLYIYPNGITKYLNVTICYKAPIDPIEAMRDPWILLYVYGKLRMAQGEARGQYGSTLSTGGIQIQFNASEMYERGKSACEQAIAEMRKNDQPLGFLMG